MISIFTQIVGVTLAWTASPDTSVVGYKIYQMLEPSTTYSLAATVGNVVSVTLPSRPYQNAKFVATAYDSTGLESDFSNSCLYASPASNLSISKTNNGPATVITLTSQVFTGMNYRVEGSANLINWNAVSSGVTASNTLSVDFNPIVSAAFYRLVKISAPSPMKSLALLDSTAVVPPLTLTPPSNWDLRRWNLRNAPKEMKGAQMLIEFKRKMRAIPPPRLRWNIH